jgi:hypothetical protein
MTGSVTAVVVSLASVQAVLCLIGLALLQLDAVLVVIAAAVFAAVGGVTIFVLETPGRGRLATVATALPADSARPERSAA